jgi:hypothetical protein
MGKLPAFLIFLPRKGSAINEQKKPDPIRCKSPQGPNIGDRIQISYRWEQFRKRLAG